MMRPAAKAVRMADMLDASGLTDLGRNRRASEHERECQCKKTHGRLAQYIGLASLASDR